MLIEQRSPEWYDLRKGKITSSEIHKIMGEGRNKADLLSDTAKTYLLQKVSEKFGGFTAPAVGEALDWGVELEDTARNIYQATTGFEVEKCSFIAVNDYYGGSPDSLVNPEGTLEIKCPYSSANHFKHGLITTAAEFKKVTPSYYYQCISHMVVTGRKWCDFVSFDPRVNSEYMLFTFRLHRNEEEVANMLDRVEVAAKYMQELIQKLPKFTPPPTPGT